MRARGDELGVDELGDELDEFAEVERSALKITTSPTRSKSSMRSKSPTKMRRPRVASWGADTKRGPALAEALSQRTMMSERTMTN